MWRSNLRLYVRRRRRAASTPILDSDNHEYGVQLGLQTDKSSFVLTLELIDELIELILGRADLLRKQIDTVLQVTTDVTHLIIPRRRKPPTRAVVPGSPELRTM